ncbi:hypothetical protein PHLGIDRAFT_76932 [Phlebiopsis gigantea 11061_1 CR5-6]|uniref:AB hydrolase-1 domain-containing protein n=1 Tax=Phlebiopsis gigantea (strain 11061_1 CR5-6) TaxID=745531 RepID=A0A0C3PEK2_PHLG1|nr:hypothetical protein PHLGIDRAFT_76932 [Phlebiopsis gigantea 11061_1 CR5-6]
MPTAPVNEKGAVVYYEDTGAPEGRDDYLTLVLVHGLSFHGAVFSKMVPYAAAHNVRIVRMNLRDYPGATPFSPEELAALSSDDVTQQTAATKAHGDETAAFLEYFVKKHIIPKIVDADGTRTGGLALVTWSMSNILAFSFLGNARWFPLETSSFLEQYVRAVVLYDPSISSLGLPPAEGVYSPLRDRSLSLDEGGAQFIPWVSNYFEAIPDLASATPAVLAARRTAAKAPTVARMSPAELEALLDRGALMRSSAALFRVARAVLHANFRRALLDTAGVWPRVKVLLVWCDESMHDCLWAAKTIVAFARAPREDGDVGTRREVEVEKLAGANHFPHWDMPEAVVQLLAAKV